LILCFVELELAMNLRGREKHVDTPALSGGRNCLAGRIDIIGHATGKTADDRPLDLLGNRLHGLEIAIADDGESGFDHVDIQACELARDLKFFAQVHGRARALLAIAQRRVEDYDSVVFHKCINKNPTAVFVRQWGLEIVRCERN
jgi:hypothetical protein